MPQDLVSLFLISHNLLVYVHMWGIYTNICGGIYTNAPVSAIIDLSKFLVFLLNCRCTFNKYLFF